MELHNKRNPHWNYAKEAAYLITICTKNLVSSFGTIEEGILKPLPIVAVLEKAWIDIPANFPFIKLGAFTIMPNHIHGILKIDRNDVGKARLIAPLNLANKSGGFAGFKNPMLNENISRVVRWYKGRCSFLIRKSASNFSWESNFGDHVIHDEVEYLKVHDYIINNIKNWESDKFFIDSNSAKDMRD